MWVLCITIDRICYASVNLHRLASRQVQRLPVATTDWASGRHRLRPSHGADRDINISHYTPSYLTRVHSNKFDCNLTNTLISNYRKVQAAR